jgi:hypothetical protein
VQLFDQENCYSDEKAHKVVVVVQIRVTQEYLGNLGKFTPVWLAVGSDNGDDEYDDALEEGDVRSATGKAGDRPATESFLFFG